MSYADCATPLFNRPALGTQYVAPDGETVTVAATWQSGVVFKGERCATASELQTLYTPITQRGNNS